MRKDSNNFSSARFSPEIYTTFSLGDLILSGMYLVTSKKEACTFERLVAECFKNFPDVFSFSRYPKWPDALKFDRYLRELREKGFITGSIRDKFSLNRYGEKKATDILKKLKKGKLPKIARFSQSTIRSADDRIINYIKNSAAFLRYLKNPKRFYISEQEFRNILRCTLETPDRILKQNLKYYLKTAEEYDEKQILRFLLLCKRKFLRGRLYGKGSPD